MEDRKRTAVILQVVGAAIGVVGGILAAVGTTSTGLFVLYLAMLFGGLGLVAWGRHLYNETLKG